jgi:hypothetical protein
MDREACRTEVTTHMMGLVSQVEKFASATGHGIDFGSLRLSLLSAAVGYSTLLEEPARQEGAAYMLCEAMFGDAEPPAEFWATETGRAVALAIGYPRPYAPRPIVEHILAPLSRQRVGEMIKLGKLTESVDEQGKRWVTASSIKERMRVKVAGQ